MKYLMFILMAVMFSVPVMADDDDYPGQTPSWDTRHTVSCTMTNNADGALNYSFAHGYLDYKQAGSLVTYLQQGQIEWYKAVIEHAGDYNIDRRLLPNIDTRLQDMIEIERLMSGKFDER